MKEKIVKPCTNEDCEFFAQYDIQHSVPFAIKAAGTGLAGMTSVCIYCVHFTRFDLLKVTEQNG